MTRTLVVRHFRQIVVWPLQLMPLRPGQQVQRHWEALEAMKGDNHWREVVDEFTDPTDFHERHYKEFVTFLPYVQRFLYGSTAGQESAAAKAQGSMHVFRRDDVARVRIVFQPGEEPTLFEVAHIDLYNSSSTRTSRSSRSRCTPMTFRSIARRTRCSVSAARIRPTGNATAMAATAPIRSSG